MTNANDEQTAKNLVTKEVSVRISVISCFLSLCWFSLPHCCSSLFSLAVPHWPRTWLGGWARNEFWWREIARGALNKEWTNRTTYGLHENGKQMGHSTTWSICSSLCLEQGGEGGEASGASGREGCRPSNYVPDCAICEQSWQTMA